MSTCKCKRDPEDYLVGGTDEEEETDLTSVSEYRWGAVL